MAEAAGLLDRGCGGQDDSNCGAGWRGGFGHGAAPGSSVRVRGSLDMRGLVEIRGTRRSGHIAVPERPPTPTRIL
jgi:hypothetical protein